ncbi:MAG TPA: UDP-2,3-diacylglucosamine diphosphatase [Gemmatimonadota bacterium]|nr:UDP-2,3-diacylglucosamine diphosphatase [Gemmatimonadota bacterium]
MSFVTFLSDVHLGAHAPAVEAAKERDLVALLDGLEASSTLYLLGDVFDFWFDYAKPPRKHGQVLRALQRARSRAINIAFMGGNHDYWVRVGRGPGWLERELGIRVLEDPHLARHDGLALLLTHGDALGGARGGYRAMRAVLRNPVAIFAFRLLGPGVGHWLADRTSAASRGSHSEAALALYRDRLRATAARELSRADVDAVVAGHVHAPELSEHPGGVYLNLGDWTVHRTYGRLADGTLSLERFKPSLQPRPRLRRSGLQGTAAPPAGTGRAGR